MRLDRHPGVAPELYERLGFLGWVVRRSRRGAGPDHLEQPVRIVRFEQDRPRVSGAVFAKHQLLDADVAELLADLLDLLVWRMLKHTQGMLEDPLVAHLASILGQ